MSPSEIQHPANLETFVAGRETSDETTRILQHLESCPECFERVEFLWQTRSGKDARGLQPGLAPVASTRVRRRVLHRIHLTDLGSEVLRLAGRGVLAALQAIIDLGEMFRRPSERGKPDD